MAKKTKRKSISKKVRFEIFKRDMFKCVYCGNKAPDILLQIDHIIPVSKGGDNDLTNLVTSCESCNNGKRDKSLDDHTTVEKKRNQMERLQEKREQFEMISAWQKGLRDIEEEKVNNICEYWHDLAPGYEITENGKKQIRQLMRKYQLEEIFEAMKISSEKYLIFGYNDLVTNDSWEVAFNKIGGICYTRKKIKENPEYEDIYKIKNIAKKKFFSFYDKEALRLLKDAIKFKVPIEELYSIAANCYRWLEFKKSIEAIIEEYRRSIEST